MMQCAVQPGRLEMIPYKAEHVLGMDSLMSPGQQDYDYLAVTAKQMERGTEAWTLFYDGAAVASGGFVKNWKGNYGVWLYSNAANLRPLALVRTIRQKIAEFGDRHFWRRLETTVRVDVPNGCKFAEILGFKRDGFAEQFNPDGCDSFRYSIVKGGQHGH